MSKASLELSYQMAEAALETPDALQANNNLLQEVVKAGIRVKATRDEVAM